MVRPVVLQGEVVRLEPLAPAHVEGLAAAAAEDRSTYAFTRVPEGREAMRAYVDEALADQADGSALPFAVCLTATGRVVGSTRFLDLDSWRVPTWPPGRSGGAPGDAFPDVAEIGSTWLAASVQRSGVNTEAKRLLLTHAFETWELLRVTLKTDARNIRSRRAIERIGARFEGVRRAHLLATDGSVRDSAYYSIVRAEWPEVRDRLATLVVGSGPGQGQQVRSSPS